MRMAEYPGHQAIGTQIYLLAVSVSYLDASLI